MSAPVDTCPFDHFSQLEVPRLYRAGDTDAESGDSGVRPWCSQSRPLSLPEYVFVCGCGVPSMTKPGIRGFGQRRQWWLLGVAAVLAAAAFGVKGQAPLLSTGAAVALIGFLTAEVLPFLRKSAEQEDQVDKTVRKTVARRPVAGSMPKVASVTARQLGVHQPTIEVPYQRRDIEDEAAGVLATREPLLVLGESMAGKSCMCAHIIRTNYAGWRLTQPLPEGLPELLEGTQVTRMVVWLDDLERYLNVKALRPDWVDLLVAGGNIVVATMRATAHAAFEPVGNMRHAQLKALQRFTVKRLKGSPEETERLAAAMPDPAAAAGVSRYGLGAYLGGGSMAVNRYEDAHATHPLGRAMVHVAVDWHRIGLTDINTTRLTELAPAYILDRDVEVERPDQALSWAKDRVFEVVQLLEPAGPDVVQATDFMLDHLTREGAAIPELLWEAAVSGPLSTESAMAVALSAYAAGRGNDAGILWEAASESGDLDAAPLAAVNLGVLRKEQGDLKAAVAAFQLALGSGHNFAAPLAAANLGALRQEQGDLKAAAAAFQLAIDSGHNEAASVAALALGVLREEEGDPEAAATAYGLAIESGHADLAPLAAVAVGLLRKEEGDLKAAAAAYQLAIDSGHNDAAPKAAFNLGALRHGEGELKAAAAAFQLAIDSGHNDAAPKAAVELGLLREEEGDPEAAAAAFQLAIESGHADLAPEAAFSLGMLRHEEGELEAAAAAYQLAIESGHGDHAPKAAFNLGALRHGEGELKAAAAAYQLAIESGHNDAAPKAAVELGLLRQEEGELKAAAAAFQLAIESGHADSAPKAAVNLGTLREEEGDREGAVAAFELAIESGHADQAPKAAFNLGTLRQGEGDLEVAAATFQLVIESGHAVQAPKAAANLGVLRAEQGDLKAAAVAYQLAVDSGHEDAAPVAAFNLGRLRAEQGDLKAAAAAYQLAVESGHEYAAPLAAVNLGVLRAGQGIE
jgi:TolA-binding protein